MLATKYGLKRVILGVGEEKRQYGFQGNVAEKWVLFPNPANGHLMKGVHQVLTQTEQLTNDIHSHVIWKKEVPLNHYFLGDFLIKKDNLVYRGVMTTISFIFS